MSEICTEGGLQHNFPTEGKYCYGMPSDDEKTANTLLESLRQ